MGLENVKDELEAVDFSSIYWYIENEVQEGEEIFGNYGSDHNSAIMFALFGFIDGTLTDKEDRYYFHVELLDDDPNYDFKKYWFAEYWPYHTAVSRHPAILYGDTILLNGQSVHKVDELMSKNMRLNYLTDEYFDSFTISSIINGFERKYLRKVIDPLVNEGVKTACSRLLQQYDTSYNDDLAELERVGLELEKVTKRKKESVDAADKQAVQDELWRLGTLQQVRIQDEREGIFDRLHQ